MPGSRPCFSPKGGVLCGSGGPTSKGIGIATGSHWMTIRSHADGWRLGSTKRSKRLLLRQRRDLSIDRPEAASQTGVRISPPPPNFRNVLRGCHGIDGRKRASGSSQELTGAAVPSLVMRQRPEGSLAAGAFPETTTQPQLPLTKCCRCRRGLPRLSSLGSSRSRPDSRPPAVVMSSWPRT